MVPVLEPVVSHPSPSRRALGAPTRLGLFVVVMLGLAACDPARIRDIIEAGRGTSSGGSATGGTTGSGGATTPPAVTCGGLAGLTCPGTGHCVDDPNDACDPNKGGADCAGTCQCVENQACIKGDVFDSSPKVCACVPAEPPPPPVCGPVCDIYCQYGHALDASGCETCACNAPPSTDPCAAVKCAAGTHCTTVIPPCAPGTKSCPPQAMCVADAPDTVFCGGIAGIACPGRGQCIDNPNDGCDPKSGGADCGGMCTCVETVLCVKGATFDSSPKVCACVTPTPPPPPPPVCGPVCQIFCENGNVLDAAGCPTCACNPPPVTDPCATVRCAAGTHCAAIAPPCAPGAGACPPQAMCVADASKVTCGGFAGIACPGSGKCTDDPSDACDPKAGGAYCSGVCTCVQNVACIKGATFDSSPKVCACVTATPPPPPPPTCGPVCAIACTWGHVKDASGCPTCACNPPPKS